jgi:hypothetical protein
MRFADFWYTANGTFTDLRDYAKEIAGDAGLTMTSEEAWRWLGQGGFINQNCSVEFGACGVHLAKQIVASFTNGDQPYGHIGMSHFVLNLDGAEREWAAEMRGGYIRRHRMYRRGSARLPMAGMFGWLAQFLRTERTLIEIRQEARRKATEGHIAPEAFSAFFLDVMTVLEALVQDGWVVGRAVEGELAVQPYRLDVRSMLHSNAEAEANQRIAV